MLILLFAVVHRYFARDILRNKFRDVILFSRKCLSVLGKMMPGTTRAELAKFARLTYKKEISEKNNALVTN